jgi:dihydroflavonol-4-reductase
LAAQLADRGARVRALDTCPTGLLPDCVEQWQIDVCDPASVRPALAGVDVVYHLAGKISLAGRDHQAWRINVDGVRVTAEAALAAGVSRFVYCSSIGAFDQTKADVIDETCTRDDDPALPAYDRAKWAGEGIVRELIGQGLDAVMCNPTGIYGPPDPGPTSRINKILLRGARGRIPLMVDGGFDFVDVRDVVAGLVAAAEKGQTGHCYLLGGEQRSVFDMFQMVARARGRRGPVGVLPSGVLKPLVPVLDRIARSTGRDSISRTALETLGRNPRIDHSKAGRDLGFNPRPLEETVSDLLGYYVAAGLLPPRRRRRAAAGTSPA